MAGAIGVLVVHTSSPRYRHLAGSLVNPLFLFALLCGIYALDFLVLRQSVLTEGYALLRGMSVTDMYAVADGFEIFGASVLATIGGLLFASFLPMPGRKRVTSDSPPRLDRRINAARISSWLVLAASLPVAYAILRDAGGDLTTVTVARQMYFSENQLSLLVLTLNLPAAVFLIATSVRASRMPVVLIVLHAMCLAFLGGRAFVLYLGAALLTRRATQGRPVPAIAAVAIVPSAFLAFAVIRYFYRDSVLGITLYDFLFSDGGFAYRAFTGLEISMSQVLSIISIDATVFDRYPFESFFGAAAFLIPRSIFPGKPVGASTHFSQVMHPEHWAAFRSETVISGFADMYLMFGYFGLPLLFLLGVALQRTVVWALHLPSHLQVVAITYLCINVFLFVRNDVYNMAPNLWALAIFQLLFLGAKLASAAPPPTGLAVLSRTRSLTGEIPSPSALRGSNLTPSSRHANEAKR